jgi:DNA-binding XRE family transcriptional regulator
MSFRRIAARDSACRPTRLAAAVEAAERTLDAAQKSVVCQRFGQAVRVTRERAAYSQDKFAAHADMDRSYFGAIERGEVNVSLSTIIKIATALDTKPSALFRLASL